MTLQTRELTKLNYFIDELNDIKEIINNEISYVRYNQMDKYKAFESFKSNMETLASIGSSVRDMYTNDLNNTHYICISLMKIVNMLELSNIRYHDFIDEKFFSGNNDMGIYDNIVDYLVTVFQDLCNLRGTIEQIISNIDNSF